MDREQFIQYARRSEKELRRFLTALCCGDSSLADDLAQDALVKAYLSCGNLREEAKAHSWLFRIAYNTFVSSRRTLHYASGLEEAKSIPSDSAADASFRYQALYEALSRINARERTAILLYYMEGYDIKEISQITGASTDAVKQQLARGRQHLKQLLDYGT